MENSSSNSQSDIIINYSQKTKNICICFAFSFLLIVVFMMTPLNKFIITSIFGRVLILTILLYLVYYNLYITNKFSNNFDVKLTKGNWNHLKANILCSHVFSIFLIILIISILSTFYKKTN